VAEAHRSGNGLVLTGARPARHHNAKLLNDIEMSPAGEADNGLDHDPDYESDDSNRGQR